MNIAVVTFTCKRDGPLLPVWAEHVRRALAGCQFTLFAAADVQDAPEALPPDVNLLTTDFAREGNLNGPQAVAGVLATLAQCGKASQADWVIKLDTDTVLTGVQWLTGPQAADMGYIGFEGANPLTATGICYALRPAYAARMLAAVNPWPWQQGGKLPEDETVCTLALMVQTHAREAVLVPWQGGVMVTAANLERASDLRAMRTAAAIHCGQWQLLKAYGHVGRTTIVLRFMQALLRTFYPHSMQA